MKSSRSSRPACDAHAHWSRKKKRPSPLIEHGGRETPAHSIICLVRDALLTHFTKQCSLIRVQPPCSQPLDSAFCFPGFAAVLHTLHSQEDTRAR